tara:strand:- start:738 stop:1352 length:615 start_codon:yes stop_codon:yes gene_type:complete
MNDNENENAWPTITYEIPKPPSKDQFSNKTYFCDFCSINRTLLNDEERTCNIVKEVASFDGVVHLNSHLKTAKHIKKMKELEELKENNKAIFCKECKGWFSTEAYEIHKNRNEMFWRLSVEGRLENGFKSCNNIVFNNRRFGSYFCLRLYKQQHDEYKWKKKTYNKYMRLLREGKGKKKVHDSVKKVILNKFKELGLNKYNNNK